MLQPSGSGEHLSFGRGLHVSLAGLSSKLKCDRDARLQTASTLLLYYIVDRALHLDEFEISHYTAMKLMAVVQRAQGSAIGEETDTYRRPARNRKRDFNCLFRVYVPLSVFVVVRCCVDEGNVKKTAARRRSLPTKQDIHVDCRQYVRDIRSLFTSVDTVVVLVF